jgi:hypothetical protein
VEVLRLGCDHGLAGAGGGMDEVVGDGAVVVLRDAGAEVGVDEDGEFVAHGGKLELRGL